VIFKGQTRDPNTVRLEYNISKNSWRCYFSNNR